MSVSLEIDNLSKTFLTGTRGQQLQALSEVNLRVASGTTLGIIGESGSGKSTLARCILRLIESSQGSVTIGGVDIFSLSSREMRRARSNVQMIFQDPYESLNPRMTVRNLLEEPLQLARSADRLNRARRVIEILDLVGLDPRYLNRFPRELSGGQLQRVGIGRAIITDPGLVVLDEPTSSLDLSVRAGILALLADLQRRAAVTYVLISHDIESVARLADRVAVMYLGRIVEEGPVKSVLGSPQHPYTQALLSASLSIDPDEKFSRFVLEGEIPSAVSPPPGCPFSSRCPLVLDECKVAVPAYRHLGPDHRAACIRIDHGENLIPGLEGRQVS